MRMVVRRWVVGHWHEPWPTATLVHGVGRGDEYGRYEGADNDQSEQPPHNRPSPLVHEAARQHREVRAQNTPDEVRGLDATKDPNPFACISTDIVNPTDGLRTSDIILVWQPPACA